jgi:3-methyladenine DNA glycosylase/8-oxoguanine DNA glycosylase
VSTPDRPAAGTVAGVTRGETTLRPVATNGRTVRGGGGAGCGVPLDRLVETRRPVDLDLTLGPLAAGGRFDPCVRRGGGGWWRATRTADGPATTHLRVVGSRRVRALAWGPGAGAALDGVPDLLGAQDDPPALFGHPLVSELDRRYAGLRIGRTGNIIEALVPTVLAQKVIGIEARRAYVALVRAGGRRAPGPVPLLLPPEPAWLRSCPSWAFHRWGVEHRRAATIAIAAGYAARLDEAASLDLDQARRRLAALPGVGPWTVAEVAMVALGDADAVSVGDYWLPHAVTYALTGAPRGTDERMLELLEPWRGQRGRVCRLIMLGGPGIPRFGPRLPLRLIADQ